MCQVHLPNFYIHNNICFNMELKLERQFNQILISPVPHSKNCIFGNCVTFVNKRKISPSKTRFWWKIKLLYGHSISVKQPGEKRINRFRELDDKQLREQPSWVRTDFRMKDTVNTSKFLENVFPRFSSFPLRSINQWIGKWIFRFCLRTKNKECD